MGTGDSDPVEVVRAAASLPSDERILDVVGDARFVLIGEASHGTHEFYDLRAALTRRLVQERGFDAVAVEADWPDAYRVNCFVEGRGGDTTADEALGGFLRFPRWMWRNTVVGDFVTWLRHHNAGAPPGTPPVGFYGLDLYSLYGSMEEVLRYLDGADPEAAVRARARYACFDHGGGDSQSYGYAASTGIREPCEDEVVEQLVELQRRAAGDTARDGGVPDDEHFHAEQNAQLVKDAEEYYRAMFSSRTSSWNLRDRHMARTLDALAGHLGRQRGRPAKVVVWAHNSHVGDARATEMGWWGELNVGQLTRESHGAEVAIVGLTTSTGTVTAASEWDGGATRMDVRPALAGSYEALLSATGLPTLTLDLRDPPVAAALAGPRLERAIGVLYRPQHERSSHWFDARLPEQFDALVHLDATTALAPLDPQGVGAGPEAPETYPSGR